jgi:anhydro-N-acetylmuramic acid kinase
MTQGKRPSPTRPMLAIGLMSGTSLDGIDAALIETDGVAHVRPVASYHLPYDSDTRAGLRQALDIGLSAARPSETHEALTGIERQMTVLHAEAVGALLAANGLSPPSIDVIGFHGQTIAHRPARGWTWQIGDGARLAAMTRCPVINDFRSADVTAGGQGAPLVPLYHAALVHAAGFELPTVVVNIGGVANVTWVGRRDIDLIAFDTGPGNALIDDWMMRCNGTPMDANGAAAAAGSVHQQLVDSVLDAPWFDAPPPKSLDRNDFDLGIVRGLSTADGAATLAHLTATAIARAAEHFPLPAKRWIVAGGGRHNPVLMRMLGDRLGAKPGRADEFGWDGDALEAQAFAYLAVRSLAGLPLSMPGTTGVPDPQTGGVLHLPSGG